MATSGTKDPRGGLIGENILSASQIKLYGRVFDGFGVGPADNIPPNTTGTNDLNIQINKKDAKFARIYGYAFEGTYYKLPQPYLYLVHGDGEPVPERPNATSIDQWGVEIKDAVFADDIRLWRYDKVDMSVRCEITSGTLEEILLGPAMDCLGRMSSLRAEMASRAEMSSRAEMTSRAEMSSRAEMTMRNRMK